MGNIHSTSFPEETERLTDDLLNPAFRDRLLSEYKVFMDAYHENRALLRFHYHRPQALLTRLEDLSLPRKEFRSDMTAVPATGRFITEDEIAASLANGSSFEGGKTRIYAFFQTQHTPKDVYKRQKLTHAVRDAPANLILSQVHREVRQLSLIHIFRLRAGNRRY